MQKNSLKVNTLYSIIKSCSTIIFPLITFPYISRVLLTENVGKINFSSSIVSYFAMLASLGITTYAVRECSYVKEDKMRLEKTSSEIFSINILTTIIAYILLIVLLFIFPKLKSYNLLIVIQSLSIVFTTLGADWINTAMEDFRYITLRTFFFQLLSLICMFLFVKSPGDYLKYAAITVISSSGGNLVNIFYRRKYCKIKVGLHLNLKKHLPPILTLFAMILAQQIFVNSDTTILGIIKGDYQVGLYTTSVKIYNIINTFISSIAWVVMPKLATSFSKKDYININSILKFIIGFTCTVGIPIVLGLFLLAPEIIDFIAGPNYINASSSLRVLALALFFSLGWGVVMNMLLLPDGEDKVCLKACSISAVMNIILNLLFIPRYGLVAAALTTTLSQFIGLLVCIPKINKNITFYVSKKFIVAVLAGSISIVVIFLFNRLLLLTNTLFLILTIFESSLVYFIIQLLLKNYWVEDMLKSLKKRVINN